jgi:xylulokinase
MSEITVGIDIGSTSVKAVAADGDGHVVARARVRHPLLAPAADRLEHDANKAWRLGPRRALKALAVDDVKAVSVVAMVPSFTAVDRRGMPGTPGLIYGDGRGRRPDVGTEAEGFLAWTAAESPGARGYWPAQAVANHSLSGEVVLDTSAAASSSPVFSLEQWGWDAELLARHGARPDQLPRVAGMGEAVGRVRDLGDAVLDCGGVDAVGEQIVAGAGNEGDVLVLLGTTLIVWAVTAAPPADTPFVSFPHMGAPGMNFVGGPSNAGGLFLGWVDGWLGRPRGKGPDAADPRHIPVWAPFPRGERDPYEDHERRGMLADLDLTHGAAAVRRAALEASCFVARRFIEASKVPARRIVATGGGVRMPGWTQALADCTGLPVDVVAVPEGAALGAAFMARMAAGLETSMDGAARWARTAERVEADPAWAGPTAARYDRFLEVAG